MNDEWVLFAHNDMLHEVNAWVLDCDVDARNGYGRIRFTQDRARAKRFPSVIEALDYWKRPSTVRPLRDDGKPNRPLTAYTVEPQKL